MTSFQAANPNYRQTLRTFVLSMPVAKFYGFYFGRIEPGLVETIQPYRAELGHAPGYFQGSIVGAIADFAGAPAAFTLLPAGWSVATIDFTVKIVAHCAGDRLIARGEVIRPGQSVTVARVEVYAANGEKESHCASAFVTTRNLEPRKPSAR